MRACDMEGRIHSIESFGTVDGPGVRYVVFFQGCPMRCLYCHNPDTWACDGGARRTVASVLEPMLRNRAFYRTGGLTATGGEPLMQLDFLTELFEAAKRAGVHTCLDTSGICFIDDARFERLMRATDLVMLDLKHADPEAHRRLTGRDNAVVLAFARYLAAIKKPVWIRHVLVPGLTDGDASLRALAGFIQTLGNVEKIEVLPYHVLAKPKYAALGIPYPLPHTPPATAEAAAQTEALLTNGF